MPDFAGAEKVDWTEIPIIDLSALSLDEQASKIINAATTVGFFYVKNHGIAQELIDQAFAASRGFFELCRAGGKSDAHDEQASRFGPPEP